MPDHVLDEWMPRNRVKDDAFWSTSTSSRVADDFRIRNGGNSMITIEGGHGTDVQALSHFGDEAEILVRPGGTYYDVVSRDWNHAGFWEFVARQVGS